MTKEEILGKGELIPRDNVPDYLRTHFSKNHIFKAMDEYAEQEAIKYLNWVIETYTTDEDRLPISYNTVLGGNITFIDGKEYPISYWYKSFKHHQLKDK